MNDSLLGLHQNKRQIKVTRAGAIMLSLCCCGWMSAAFPCQVFSQSTSTKPADQAQSSQAAEPEKPVTADNSAWLDVKPTGAAAEFKMPVKPRYIERTFTPVENEPPIKVHLHISSFNSGLGAFVFSYHDMHRTPTTQLEIDNTLNGAVIGSIANVQGKPLSQQAIRYREYPGRAFVYLYAQNDQIFQVSARSFLVGKRQFQISALMKQDAFDEKIATAFLDTFRILDPQKSEQPESKSDSEPQPEISGKEKSASSAEENGSTENVESGEPRTQEKSPSPADSNPNTDDSK